MTAALFDFLMDHQRDNPVSFHMPGHKGNEELYRKYGFGGLLDLLLGCDVTEIEGADNLFQAETVIRQVQERFAALYGVKQAWALINGTSAGILASVMASVSQGGKLILSRNCHKSVFNAMRLAGASPVFVLPEILPEWGVAGAVSAEEIDRSLGANPDAAAVILPSPNYYGICSDIRAIAEVVHGHGKTLIVDEAHGAHLNLLGGREVAGAGVMPLAAERCGADLVVTSIHKTLASFTQSAVLLRNSDRVDPALIEDKLQMVESTSPSYLLMASLDVAQAILTEHGRELAEQWIGDLAWFYGEAQTIPGLDVMHIPGRLDLTKLNLCLRERGFSGAALDEALREKRIFAELNGDVLAMAMTGIGNRRSDYEKLAAALRELSKDGGPGEQGGLSGDAPGEKYGCKKEPAPGEYAGIPARTEIVDLEQAAGRTAASMLVPYPPGIPVVCPGEILSREMVDYLVELRHGGRKVIGVSEDLKVAVGCR